MNWEARSPGGQSRSGAGTAPFGNYWRRLPVFFSAALILLAIAPLASPQASQPTEYQLKAAFLFNFAKFVDWPEKTYAGPRSPFMLCVIGQDPFGGALDEYMAKTMAGRPVQLARFPNGIATRRSAALPDHLRQRLGKSPFSRRNRKPQRDLRLLVGDAEGFVVSGGTIEFMLEDNHIRFAINPEAAQRADLKLSSKLLALAKIVHDGTNNGKS